MFNVDPWGRGRGLMFLTFLGPKCQNHIFDMYGWKLHKVIGTKCEGKWVGVYITMLKYGFWHFKPKTRFSTSNKVPQSPTVSFLIHTMSPNHP